MAGGAVDAFAPNPGALVGAVDAFQPRPETTIESFSKPGTLDGKLPR